MSAFLPQTLDGALNAVTFTAIVPAGSWDQVLVSNRGGGSALYLRTVQGDASTEITIAAGSDQSIVVPPPRVNTKPSTAQVNNRFAAGVTAFYLKTGGGTGTGAYLLWA